MCETITWNLLRGVFEKSHARTIPFGIRRIPARSIIISEVVNGKPELTNFRKIKLEWCNLQRYFRKRGAKVDSMGLVVRKCGLFPSSLQPDDIGCREPTGSFAKIVVNASLKSPVEMPFR